MSFVFNDSILFLNNSKFNINKLIKFECKIIPLGKGRNQIKTCLVRLDPSRNGKIAC